MTTPSRKLTPEQRAALARIEALLEFWQITPEEIAAAPDPVLPAKYRHPVTGESWDGTGEQPDWLRRALVQEGYRVSELRPSAEPSATA